MNMLPFGGPRSTCLVLLAAAAGCVPPSQRARYGEAVETWAEHAPDPVPDRAPAIPVFETEETLARDALVRAVLERNPDLVAAGQAWRAALAEYPQAVALDDPRLSYSLAPASVGGEAELGQVVQLSQPLPFPGKRALRGAAALAEADAASHDFAAVQRDLALMASLLYDDYWQIARELEINAELQALLHELYEGAKAGFRAGSGALQDPLQIAFDREHLRHDEIALLSRGDVVVAQLNGLLHRPPDARLPPPPVALGVPAVPAGDPAGNPEVLEAEALVRAAEARLDLAQRDYYPDFAVQGSYNSMWMEPAHELMVGVAVDVPIQIGRRRGAVDEAEARLMEARARQASVVDDVAVDVRTARRRLEEALHVVALYEERLLPTAREHLDAARAGYAAGTNTFLAVVEAARNLRTALLGQARALAEARRRRAELERARGELPALPDVEAR